METKALSWEKLFQKVGLSKYEAKIYISLAVRGSSEAKGLSTTSGVPRTKVYDTLKKLVERGLVVEIPGEPQQFDITSPADAFKILVDNMKDMLSEKVTSLVELENAIAVLKQIHVRRQSTKPTVSQLGDVWFIGGRSEALHKIREMLSKARRSVDVTTTENGLILFYRAFNKLLDKLEKRNIKIRMKTQIGRTNKALVRELKYAYEIKHLDVPTPMLFICTDEHELLLIKLKPDNFNAEAGQDFGFFSQNRTLCTFFSSLYGFNEK